MLLERCRCDYLLTGYSTLYLTTGFSLQTAAEDDPAIGDQYGAECIRGLCFKNPNLVLDCVVSALQCQCCRRR